MDRQLTPRQVDRRFIVRQLAEQQQVAKSIEQQRATLRELPLPQKLSLGYVGCHLNLLIEAARQRSLIAELDRQKQG